MSVTLAIAWRDLKNLVLNPMIHVIMGLFTVLLSFFYMRNLFVFAQRSRLPMPGMGEAPSLQNEVFAQHVSLVHLLMILVTPVLTMRLLAEERKLRTFDLLLTSPITASQIAVGKYVAGLGSAMLIIGVSFLYPLFTGFLTSFTWGALLALYLGLILVVAIYVAVGLFASSLTESVMLSVVMGWVLSLMVFFLGHMAFNNTDPFWTPVFEHLSLPEHFTAFILGTIRTKSVVFMLSIVALFLFLTERVVESSRWR